MGSRPRTEPALLRSVKQLHRRILPGEVEMAIERRKAFYRDAADGDLIAYLGAGRSRVELKAFERSLLAQDSRHAPEWMVKAADSRALGDISHDRSMCSMSTALCETPWKGAESGMSSGSKAPANSFPMLQGSSRQPWNNRGFPRYSSSRASPMTTEGVLHGLSDPIVVIDRRVLLSSGIDLDSFDPELAVKRILGDPAKAPRLDEHLVLFRSENK